MPGFRCRICGQDHDDLPMHYGVDAPAYWFEVDPSQRDGRCELTADRCVIDGQFFFLRGNLEVPVVDGGGPFSWGVWVSLSEANFARACELWETPGRESEPPYFGWLSSALPGYPDTINLKTLVHTRPVGRRPIIELEPTDHPLAVEQRQGITLDRVREIAEMVLHPEAGG